MYVHENNIDTKIKNNYSGHSVEITSFKINNYLPMREKLLGIDYSSGKDSFNIAADIINDYLNQLHKFAKDYNIKSQSKFESTFLEEISCYLFKDIQSVKGGQLDFFNKGIYAGLKINEDLSINVITKDVDFCIGKKVALCINDQKPIELIIPAVSVEVKTYLDATMFGEIKSSSKTLKSSTPNSKAYVLMGYKDLADEHILAARQDSTLDELFALRANANSPIDANALQEYYYEISSAIDHISTPAAIIAPGRLFSTN